MKPNRKPVLLEAINGKGPRQRIWEAICKCEESFTRREISRVANVHDETTRSYLEGLEKAGYIALAKIDLQPKHRGACKGVPHFMLVRNTGVEAPRVTRNGEPVTQGLAQEQMWRSLRMLKTDINATELAAYASTSTITVSPVAAGDYLRTLNTAGYMAVTQEASRHRRAGQGTTRYKLKPARNTGPRPPMICRTSVVFDPNENRIVWQKGVTEEDVIYG